MASPKFLIYSDLHGSKQGLSYLLSAIQREKPDVVLCLGDVLHGWSASPREVAFGLKEVSDLTLYVRGNNDYEEDEEELGVEMPYQRNLLYEGHNLYLMHRPPLFGRYAPGDIVMHGHTHVKRLENLNGVFYFNPGSIALPRDGRLPSYGILCENKLSIISLPNFETFSELSF